MGCTFLFLPQSVCILLPAPLVWAAYPLVFWRTSSEEKLKKTRLEGYAVAATGKFALEATTGTSSFIPPTQLFRIPSSSATKYALLHDYLVAQPRSSGWRLSVDHISCIYSKSFFEARAEQGISMSATEE